MFWLTGLSGSGKSTVALAAERRLFERGALVKVIDGDDVRTALCADLGFSLDDRRENIRRIASVARLFCDSGASTTPVSTSRSSTPASPSARAVFSTDAAWPT